MVLSLQAPIRSLSSAERSMYCKVLTDPVNLPFGAADRISQSLTCLSTPPVKMRPDVIPAQTVWPGGGHGTQQGACRTSDAAPAVHRCRISRAAGRTRHSPS
eukprot:scaffold1607_cov417-Prasinococcus_capsulatus_cf.AAC.11